MLQENSRITDGFFYKNLLVIYFTNGFNEGKGSPVKPWLVKLTEGKIYLSVNYR